MEFKEGTVYVFQSKLVIDDNPSEADLLWRSKCNNRIVKMAILELLRLMELYIKL